MGSIKSKPPICMRCKRKTIDTAGSLFQDGKMIAWHYRCRCGWRTSGGKYPKIDFKNPIDVTIPEEWFSPLLTNEELLINLKELTNEY